MIFYLAGLFGALGLYIFSRTEQGQSVIDRATAPRGIRNKNPGNIDWIAAPEKRWRGMVRKETPAEGGRFGVFDTDQNGVRAIGQELLLDERRGVRTVAGLISSWAPPTENNTKAYVAKVLRDIRVSDPDMPIDVHTYLPRLVASIIEHENGSNPYSISDITRWVNS